jgi:hypothetical protein
MTLFNKLDFGSEIVDFGDRSDYSNLNFSQSAIREIIQNLQGAKGIGLVE